MEDTPPRSRWWRRGLIAGAVVVVLAVGGPFVYINVLKGDAPAALTASRANADEHVDPTVPIDGDWTVSSGSQAGYRIKEVLMGQSTEAVGRTSAVTGTVTIAGDKVTQATFTVDLTSVASDSSQRDGQFRNRIMQTSTYPKATFTLTAPVDISTLPRDGTSGTVQATGDLTLHGVSRSVTVPLTTRRTATGIEVSAAIPVAFADYGISNPSAGPAQVGDTGTVEVLLDLTHAA